MQHSATGSESPSWEELLGSNNWSGLLQPLDQSLQALILQCGDMTQAIGDGCMKEKNSKYIGKPRYAYNHLFERVYFPYSERYNIPDETCYINAVGSLLWIPIEVSWMGYVAVSTDEYARATSRREIYVVWRGTELWVEEIKDLEAILVDPPVENSNSNGEKVMKGWSDIYSNYSINSSSAQQQLKQVLEGLVETHKGENLSVVCVGHSLGGALAILSAFDIVKSGLNKIKDKDGNESYFQVCAMVLDSPKVGNESFNNSLKELPNLKVLHVKNKNDIVPDWPCCAEFVTSGTILDIDSDESPVLKNDHDYKQEQNALGKKTQWHNLQVILHTVAGWGAGENGGFDESTSEKNWSLAQVNKGADNLKNDQQVIPLWWVTKNRGMVLKDGKWEEEAPENYKYVCVYNNGVYAFSFFSLGLLNICVLAFIVYHK